MKKEEFLKSLRDKLSVLEESEIEDVINEYREHIDEKLKTKKKETKIIEELGDIDELASDILKAYKIKDNYKEKNDFNETAKKWFDGFEDIINKIVKKFTKSSFGEIVKFIIEIFIICLLIGLVKIPFDFVENIINDLFIGWVYPLNNIFTTLFTFLIEVFYILVALLMFITIFKERYLMDEEEIKDEIISNKEIKKEKIVKVSSNNDKKVSAFDGLTSFFLIITKILLFFILVPIIFTFIVSISGLVLSILFSIEYFSILGIIVAIIGVILGHIWLITILYNFIFNKVTNGKFLFIIFLVAIAFVGTGIGYTIMKFADMEYAPISELEMEYSTKEYIYDLDEILNDYNHDFDVLLGNDENFNVIIDNTLQNKVIVKVKYIKDFMDIYTYTGNDYHDLSIYYNINAKNAIEFALKALKDKKIYDLYDNEMSVDFYISEANKEKLLIRD